jgi:hypothetical protein
MIVALGLIVLALCGAPLFAIIGASALWGFYDSEIDLSVVVIEFFRLAEMPVLLAIPLLPLPATCSARAMLPIDWSGSPRHCWAGFPGGWPLSH